MWNKDEQLHWLRHMLGINDRSAKDPVPSRNYGAVGHDDPNFAEMEKLGWVRRYGVTEQYDYWEVTDEGQREAFTSFYKRRYPLTKRRYLKFLDVRDAFPDLTFKTFITDPYFKETRDRA